MSEDRVVDLAGAVQRVETLLDRGMPPALDASEANALRTVLDVVRRARAAEVLDPDQFAGVGAYPEGWREAVAYVLNGDESPSLALHSYAQALTEHDYEMDRILGGEE